MKVTKDMLHEELQPYYMQLTALPAFMKYRWGVGLMTLGMKLGLKGKSPVGIDCGEVHVTSRDDGYAIRTRTYRPEDKNLKGRLPLMLYIHGGGYITGIPEIANEPIKRFIETRPCVVVAPDYRKAYTKPYPAGLNDCYDTLLWAIDNADDLGVDPDRIIVAGHSGGGGLTAAVTLRARDKGDVNIAFQMPIYPMIDDRQPFDSDREIHSPSWNSTMNRIGWGAYLSDLNRAGDAIPAWAAPSRNRDYSNFPPTITFVGTLEPFYWETAAYVAALRDAGVEVAFKEYKDCFHGFERIAGDTEIGKDGQNFTYDNYAEFYDRFVG